LATRIGVVLILGGICLLVVHALGWTNGDAYDLGGVLVIVIGALGVAVDGEEADIRSSDFRRR
jgi:hypothetical protein